jgi:acetyltransferase-like isoleucine patch superfamily enzyme
VFKNNGGKMNRIKRFLVNNCSQFITEKYRNKFYRIFGMNFGKGTIIRKKCFFDQDRILIGDNCFINRNCQFHMGGGTEGKITIGNNVRFGMDVELICVSHKIGGETSEQERIHISR